MKECGYHKIVTFTTRPIRDDEIDEVVYHFISENEFKEKVKDGFFAEWKSYITDFGIWYYGTSVESLENADDNSVIILTPSGLKEVCENMETPPTVVYIYANNQTIKKRLISRGDNKDEAMRRIKQDNEDFKHVEDMANKIFYNNINQDIDTLTDEVVKYLERGDV